MELNNKNSTQFLNDPKGIAASLGNFGESFDYLCMQ
jgi:hypothetical protein